jgi:hypothetical protein
MHYVTHRSNGMQKHNFDVTCPDMLFTEAAPGPPEHEKLCVYVYGIDKKRIGSNYAELVFLHSMGSAGHVVHYGVSWA